MKLYLAPMQGMTNAVYRNAFDTIFGGFDAYYAPFIATTQKKQISAKLFKDLMPEYNLTNHVTIPQLLGNNGEDFIHYGQYITDLGYNEINWNIGCPYPTVTKKLKGSGILPHPEKIEAFLETVCKEKNFDLSVKLRLGWDKVEEGIEVVKILNEYPLKEIIIHGRTGIQKYEGVVDLDGFDQLYALSKHPVVYNGDIYSYEDYLTFQKRYEKIQAFMIGRGALRHPSMAKEIKEDLHPIKEMKTKILAFHDYILNYYSETLSGDKHILDKMKEFWYYVGHNLGPFNPHLKKIRKTHNVLEYKSHVLQLMEEQKIWQD
ncbi:MAG: tRNA-dihydrouridine synthase family protein [Clostridia bacterium]|nr:tRNA-dihydrouridine synthase family protein [Clostridia bacterium]